MGGDARSTRVDVDGRLYQGFRHGDQVVLILSSEDAWPHVEAVIPTHWPNSSGRSGTDARPVTGKPCPTCLGQTRSSTICASIAQEDIRD
jgi:hypothetical protein